MWQYKLHYFQCLPQLEPKTALDLIEDWLERNPPGTPIAWDPYPISLRVREWIEWLVANPDLDEAVLRRVLGSLVHQGVVLESRLEYHLLANHLLENAMSLCWLGASLAGPLAERWLERGTALLSRELAEQVKEDGTHYERSPMYQASLAESLLRLAAVAHTSPAPGTERLQHLAETSGQGMLQSLHHLCHPDRGLALVNDSAFGEAPTLAQLAQAYDFDRPWTATDGLWSLDDAGFVGWRSGGTYLIIDAGDPSPSYNPGHAHAGMLSFELSHRGRRLVTDTGVSTYEESAKRLYQRGTAAHSTVQIDDCDQSEVWAAFRCGRRAQITQSSVESRASPTISAACACKLTISKQAHHLRAIRIDGSTLRFRDRLEARGSHRAVLRLHLGPGVEIVRKTTSIHVKDEENVELARVRGENLEFLEGVSPYCPEFGLEVERTKIEATVEFRDEVEIDWSIELA